MIDRAEFAAAVRGGSRAGHRLLAVHVRTGMERTGVGFVVSQAVGNSVIRHRVQRRLRHLMRDRLADLREGTHVVVRANPAAAEADSRDLGRALDAVLRRALGATA